MNDGNSRRANSESNFRKLNSAPAAAGDHAFVQHLDPAGCRAFAQAGDEGMEKAGKTRQKQCAGKGESHALMLEIAFAHGLGVGEKKPRKHDQDHMGRRE